MILRDAYVECPVRMSKACTYYPFARPASPIRPSELEAYHRMRRELDEMNARARVDAMIDWYKQAPIYDSDGEEGQLDRKDTSYLSDLGLDQLTFEDVSSQESEFI